MRKADKNPIAALFRNEKSNYLDDNGFAHLTGSANVIESKLDLKVKRLDCT
jgi:hypothetical protein